MQVDGTTPLWIAARVLLYGRGDELFRRRDRVLQTFDPEDIHDLRVSSRRLREGLVLFAPCYPPENIRRLDKQVKRITRFLGEMRNTDEAILFFTRLSEELNHPCRAALGPFLASLQKERKREAQRLGNGLRKLAAGEFRDYYRRSINSISLFTPRENCPDLFSSLTIFARDAFDARLAAIRDTLPLAREDGAIEAQHRLRIAVKHFRYRMELLSFLLGAGYRQYHAAVKGYQDVLGTMHDLDVFAGIVREAGFSPEAEKPVLDAIIAERGKLFRDFSKMLKSTPLEKIGEQVRNGL